MIAAAERACTWRARASRSTSCAPLTEASRSAKSGASSPPPGFWIRTAAASMSNNGSPMRCRADVHACRRPTEVAAMIRNSERSGAGPRSASTVIAAWTVVAPVSSSWRNIRTASSTASWRRTCRARTRAATAPRTNATAPAAPAAARTGSPVIRAAAQPPRPATITWRIARPAAPLSVQPAPAARALSSAHRERTNRSSQEVAIASSGTVGGGTAIARVAAVTPRPAQSAAAISSIELIEKACWIADIGELGLCALRQGRERTDAMPPAVAPERDQVTHHRAAVVQAGNYAHRRQPARTRTGVRVRRPDEAGVKHEVERVDDLGHHRLSSERMRAAQSQAGQPRERFARAFRMDGADRARMPRVHRIEQVEGLATPNLADDYAVG